MALNAQEQELFDFAVSALPKWFTSNERQREELAGFAKIFGAALTTVKYWFGQTLIGTAQGPATGLPDWLNQRAIDRGSRRQASEADVTLRERLQNVEDAVVRPALLDAANAILVAEGVAGTAKMVELDRDAACLRTLTSDTGTGGTFAAGTGTLKKFTPTVLWKAPPYRYPDVIRKVQSYRLDISGAASGGNNGQFPVTALEGNAAIFTNAAGVVGADAGVTWTVRKLDRLGNVLDGFASGAFCSRGHRISRVGGRTLVIMLPFGATATTEASVREMLRQKKAGGVKAIIERRLVP